MRVRNEADLTDQGVGIIIISNSSSISSSSSNSSSINSSKENGNLYYSDRKSLTKWVALPFWMWELLGSNIDSQTRYSEIFVALLRNFKRIPRYNLKLGHDRFLKHFSNLLFTTHPTFGRCSLRCWWRLYFRNHKPRKKMEMETEEYLFKFKNALYQARYKHQEWGTRTLFPLYDNIINNKNITNKTRINALLSRQIQ